MFIQRKLQLDRKQLKRNVNRIFTLALTTAALLL